MACVAIVCVPFICMHVYALLTHVIDDPSIAMAFRRLSKIFTREGSLKKNSAPQPDSNEQEGDIYHFADTQSTSLAVGRRASVVPTAPIPAPSNALGSNKAKLPPSDFNHGEIDREEAQTRLQQYGFQNGTCVHACMINP